MTPNPPIAQYVLDCRGHQCPGPILAVARAVADLDEGVFLRVQADDPAFGQDLRAWARTANAEVARLDHDGTDYEALVHVGTLATLDAELESVTADHTRQTPRTVAYASQAASSQPSSSASSAPASAEPEAILDMRGEQCPGPIVALAKHYTRANPGDLLRIYADDPAFPADLRSWVGQVDATLVAFDEREGSYDAFVRVDGPMPATSSSSPSGGSRDPQGRKSTDTDTDTNTALATQTERHAAERATLLVLHNDHEALLAALLVANGAASQGMQTNVFFTFWGLNLLRGDTPNLMEPKQRVGFLQRMMKWMMPRGPKRQPLGQMHFGGLGKGMLGSIMKRQNIMMLPELMRSAQSLGVTFTACTMSMSVMGITRRDLYPYPNLEFGGVASFVSDARQPGLSLVF